MNMVSEILNEMLDSVMAFYDELCKRRMNKLKVVQKLDEIERSIAKLRKIIEEI